MGRQYNNRQNYQNRNNTKITELEATLQKARELYTELRKQCKELKANAEAAGAEAERQKELVISYKALYLDELQKRLELAETVRRMEESHAEGKACHPAADP